METTRIKSTTKATRRCKEASMEKLICAATRVFSTHGYDAATTKLVAKEAGINESLINRYFDGKAGLLLALIKSYVDWENDAGPWSQYEEGKTVEEDLRNFFCAMVQHHVERQSLIKIFVSRAMVDTKVRDELKALKKGGAPESLVAHLQKFQKRGLIRKDVDVKLAALVLSNACFAMGFINHIVMGADPKLVQEAMDAFARDYVRGISPGKS